MNTRKVGFVGIGVMGQAMAQTLVDAGVDLVVWNRSPAGCEPLQQHGATAAKSVREVFDLAELVILTLASKEATDEVLERDQPRFAEMVRGRTVVHMGTTWPGQAGVRPPVMNLPVFLRDTTPRLREKRP